MDTKFLLVMIPVTTSDYVDVGGQKQVQDQNKDEGA